MGLDGRINIDVLFHDTDGTTSLKVVSLEDSTAYTTGKVAFVTGTCNTTGVTLNPYSSSPVLNNYRDAEGQLVRFTTVDRLAFKASPEALLQQSLALSVRSRDDRMCIHDGLVNPLALEMQVRSTAGTASYTLMLYGS